ncbi:MAG: hypothetical protein NC122_00240 [Faecalibacterium sp.]|nr:hypothetical protein [Ruminococcus sp.]MCM1392926.1 hypothetical protein [Ruminococcus sp.]MCM1484619.1 hypothetical protein [Faecalibacterium sp.]
MYDYLRILFPFIFVIIPIFVSIWLRCVSNNNDAKMKNNGQGGIVQYPRWVYILGLTASIVLTIILIYNFETDPLYGKIFFTSFAIGANCLMYFQLSYRIYYGNGIIMYIVCGKKYKYKVEDISNIEERENATIIHFKDGRKIDFDSNLCEGDINFIRYLNGLPPIEM